VVHSWIYRRLPAEERHQYICWVVNELDEHLNTSQRSDWDDVLFKWKSGLIPLANLSTIRNARVLLGFALSPKMVQYRAETKSFIPCLGDFLYRIGRELSINSRLDEAVHYLEAAVTEAKELPSPTSVILRRELDYLKVRGRILAPGQATIEAKEFLAAPIAENSLEAHVWLAECLISEGSIWEGAVELENIELTTPLTSDTMEDQKALVALKLSTASALGELGDSISMARSRCMLDSIIELVSSVYHGHIVRIILGPQVFKLRFELAEDYEDQCNVCRRLTEYEKAEETSFHGILGGLPHYWIDYLEELKTKQQWAELEAFAKTYTTPRASLLDMLKWRSKKGDVFSRTGYVRGMEPVEFTDGYTETVAGWAEMHDLLGQAYIGLGNMEAAEESFWSTFVLHLYGAPWMTVTDMWKEHLHHLAACLYQEGAKRQDQLGILISSYPLAIRQSEDVFGPISQKFRSRKRDFTKFSEG
jgi:hypothetical protein